MTPWAVGSSVPVGTLEQEYCLLLLQRILPTRESDLNWQVYSSLLSHREAWEAVTPLLQSPGKAQSRRLAMTLRLSLGVQSMFMILAGE